MAFCWSIVVSLLLKHYQGSHDLIPYRDILYELASVGELPLPNSSPQPTNKREWGAHSPISSDSSPAVSLSEVPIRPDSRTFAGSKRANAAASASNSSPNTDISSSSSSSSLTPAVLADNSLLHDSPSGMQLFSLPMYSNELGRLPLHGQVNFSTRPQAQTQPHPMDWYNESSSAPIATPVPGVHEMGMDTAYIQHGYLNYDNAFDAGSSPSAPTSNGTMPYPNGLLPQPSASAAGHPRYPPPQADMLSANRDRSQNMNSINMLPTLDSDTFAMWSNAPSGFE